jgi:hypothetical protein
VIVIGDGDHELHALQDFAPRSAFVDAENHPCAPDSAALAGEGKHEA